MTYESICCKVKNRKRGGITNEEKTRCDSFYHTFCHKRIPDRSLSAATVTISSDGSVDISATAGIVNPGDVINIADGVSVTLYGSSTDVRIICGQNVTLTIRDLNIGIGGLPSGSSIYFTGTGNTLLLEGSSSISGSNSTPGVRVEGSKQMGKLKFFPLTFDISTDEKLATVFSLADFRRSIK